MGLLYAEGKGAKKDCNMAEKYLRTYYNDTPKGLGYAGLMALLMGGIKTCEMQENIKNFQKNKFFNGRCLQ